MKQTSKPADARTIRARQLRRLTRAELAQMRMDMCGDAGDLMRAVTNDTWSKAELLADILSREGV